MSEVERIVRELRWSFESGAWHGPSLAELLTGVDAVEAAARPLPEAHTIWELVRHLTVWTVVATRRLAGDPTDGLPAAEDWPPVGDTSPAAWAAARRAHEVAHHELEKAVLALEDRRLADPVAGSSPDVRGMLHGVVQHNAYHGGQIALLKKAPRETPA